MSAKTKNALKISIAMVIAYGIALQMNWSNPYWAGFAVIMISLATVGQSLNKAAMRLLGTLAAAVAALSIIALFPQQRWMFMVILSIYIAFCSYMNLGKKYQYFYFVCGFVCIIICFDGGVEPVNAFKTATLRVLETGVGIISYTLVNLFIWPKNSSGDLNNASCKLFAIQIKLFSAYLQLMTDKAAEGDTQSLRVDEIQLLNKLNQALNAAETDSYKVWEVRHQWEYYLNLEARMMETLERWRESFPEIKNLDLKKYLPNMEIFCSELNERFSQIETLLEGKKSEQFLHAITLTIDKNEEASLSHFEKAAVTLTKTHLNNIEKISRSMFEYLQYIKGFNQSLPLPLPDLSNSLFKSKLSLEPDRITATVRVVVTMWVAFLLFIYFRVPGNTGFIVMATVLAMVFSSMPYLPVSSLVFPVAVSWVFGSFLYIFIMPSLSGFVELGLLIFAAIFAITYLFSKPHQALGRVVGVVLFLVMTSVNNQQTYNFLTVADTGLMFALIILLLAITAFFPVSSRPEKAFIRLLRRFFKHSEFLFLHFARDWEQKKGVSGRLKAFVYRENLLDLFRKIEIWSSNINHRLFPDTTPEQIKALTTSLQTLAYRINEIADARDQSQSKLLVKELAGDVRPWRIAIQEVFREWGSDPKFKPGGDLHQRLAKRLEKLELRINETFELAQKGKITPQDYANFYRIMGSFRSLSEAVINHARLTREINWAQLEEERF